MSPRAESRGRAARFLVISDFDPESSSASEDWMLAFASMTTQRGWAAGKWVRFAENVFSGRFFGVVEG